MRFLGARREVTLIDQAQQTTEIAMHAMVQLSLALANTSKLVLKVQPILWSNNFLCSTENKRLCQQHFLTHGPNQLRRKLSIKPLSTDSMQISCQVKNFKAQYTNEFLESLETSCWSEKRSIKAPSLSFKVKIDVAWVSSVIMLIYWEICKGCQKQE